MSFYVAALQIGSCHTPPYLLARFGRCTLFRNDIPLPKMYGLNWTGNYDNTDVMKQKQQKYIARLLLFVYGLAPCFFFFFQSCCNFLNAVAICVMKLFGRGSVYSGHKRYI